MTLKSSILNRLRSGQDNLYMTKTTFFCVPLSKSFHWFNLLSRALVMKQTI